MKNWKKISDIKRAGVQTYYHDTKNLMLEIKRYEDIKGYYYTVQLSGAGPAFGVGYSKHTFDIETGIRSWKKAFDLAKKWMKKY
jgi:hypothetical protein